MIDSKIIEIEWIDKSGEKRVDYIDFEIFFIGRVPSDYSLSGFRYTNLGIYVFTPSEGYYLHYDNHLISRKHAYFEVRDGKIFLKDHGVEGKGSKNGTFLNGIKLEPGKFYEVKDGDEIKLYNFKIVLRVVEYEKAKEFHKRKIEKIEDIKEEKIILIAGESAAKLALLCIKEDEKEEAINALEKFSKILKRLNLDCKEVENLIYTLKEMLERKIEISIDSIERFRRIINKEVEELTDILFSLKW